MDTKRFTLDTALTLVAAYLGLFVGLIDANAVNLALPAVRDDLGGGISGAQWTIDAYNITFAAMLLTSGSLGDRFGRRRLLAHRVAVFVVASLGCAAAPSTAAAVGRAGGAGRGRGADAAAGPGDHRSRVPRSGRARQGDRGMGDGRRDEHRDRADSRRRADRHGRMALHLLAQHAGRRCSRSRWPGVICPSLAMTMRRTSTCRGQILAVVGLGALTVVLVEGRSTPAGWSALLAVSAVGAIAAFLASQRRAAAPMLPLDLFRSSRLNAALTATFSMTFATYGLLLVNSFAFQQQRGASTLLTALCFLPLPLAYLTVIPIANAIAIRIGPQVADGGRGYC